MRVLWPDVESWKPGGADDLVERLDASGGHVECDGERLGGVAVRHLLRAVNRVEAAGQLGA